MINRKERQGKERKINDTVSTNYIDALVILKGNQMIERGRSLES